METDKVGVHMEGILKIGTVLESELGIKYTVNKLIGAGGQGEVYEVFNGNEHLALKWYYKNAATGNQKKILDNLVAKGAPDETFLWPQDLIYQKEGTTFGYIMPLRPKEYHSIVDLMKRKAEPSFYCLCRAAYNLTRGYQMLHKAGYSYRDISFGNIFFNPENGDVLICDNDNVAPNGEKSGGVYGTPRFMAPEIVMGKAKPSRNTDLFSLAVLLFYMFMLNHPLEGKLEAQIKCMDVLAMNKLYGTNPVFIFDPEDRSNRPQRGYQDNALIFWDLYPKELKELFIKSFTIGLKEPAKRITENKWLETFANMMSSIIICPKCGSESFYDITKEKLGATHTCWSCDNTLHVPSKIFIGKNIALITEGAKLYSHHINSDFDMNTLAGEIVRNPKNPLQWGIRNLTKTNWTYIRGDGVQIPVEPGKAAAIGKNVKIDFGKSISEFK